MATTIKSKTMNPRFRLFFLREGVDHGVEVKEVASVDFQEIGRRMEQGEAIIIAPAFMRNLEVNHVNFRTMRDLSRKQAEEPWYFTHE